MKSSYSSAFEVKSSYSRGFEVGMIVARQAIVTSWATSGDAEKLISREVLSSDIDIADLGVR